MRFDEINSNSDLFDFSPFMSAVGGRRRTLKPSRHYWSAVDVMPVQLNKPTDKQTQYNSE